MRTDNVVCIEAMDVLVATLGAVDTERFICMIKRDTFDYTEWRRDLWKEKTIEEIHSMATEFEIQNAQNSNPL